MTNGKRTWRGRAFLGRAFLGRGLAGPPVAAATVPKRRGPLASGRGGQLGKRG